MTHLIAPDEYDPTPEITALNGHRFKTACGVQVDYSVWMQAKLDFGAQWVATAHPKLVDCPKCASLNR